LLSKDNHDIIKFLKDLESNIKNLKLELFKVCWFMRGGVTYEQALNLSPEERTLVADLVKENMETTKKTGQPFF
jgi:hypothetical protein